MGRPLADFASTSATRPCAGSGLVGWIETWVNRVYLIGLPDRVEITLDLQRVTRLEPELAVGTILIYSEDCL